MFHFRNLEVDNHLKSGINLELSTYKKSNSRDERSLPLNDVLTDPETKKFRRSFSQGNIFDKISGFNRLTSINNSLNNNNVSKENINLSKLVSKDVSISPCFKFDKKLDKSSKTSAESNDSEKNTKTRLVEHDLITTGRPLLSFSQ